MEKDVKNKKDRGRGRAILIFAGTTEGRLLAEYADSLGLECFVSTATEYGRSLLEEMKGVRLLNGRMDKQQIGHCIRENDIALVVDATHPFATEVTKNIKHACEETNVRYIRCLREQVSVPEKTGGGKYPDVVEVGSVAKAVEYLKETEGNILIATGSKELEYYTAIDGFRERCFARVLSTREGIENALRLGFEGKHLIAMQGPFSEELNLALLKQTEAVYFVTKESGRTGGFAEKLSAAEKAGTVLVVIGRTEESGVSVEEIKRYLHRF